LAKVLLAQHNRLAIALAVGGFALDTCGRRFLLDLSGGLKSRSGSGCAAFIFSLGVVDLCSKRVIFSGPESICPGWLFCSVVFRGRPVFIR
jgi:hypothetical protein